MHFRGVDIREMEDYELLNAEAYTAQAIAQHTEHLEMLKAGYKAIGEELIRRSELMGERTLN